MGGMLMVAGWGLMAIGGIMILIAAFSESMLWGFGSLFIPLVALVFVFKFWHEAKKGVILELAGFGLMLLGGFMA